MLETFITVALYFGASQVENKTYINSQVLYSTEDSTGFQINEIPPSEEYLIKEENSIYIIELLGQDQNGGGK